MDPDLRGKPSNRIARYNYDIKKKQPGLHSSVAEH